MFAKILVILVVFGVLGCALLVNRQQRIETAHRMSLTHKRLAEQERGAWRLRAEVARHCSPSRLREAARRSGQSWLPLMLHPQRPSVVHPSATVAAEQASDQREAGP